MTHRSAFVFCAAVCLWSESAAATTTLKVDLGTTLHPVGHAASGSLYGLTEKVPADLNALVAPLHPSVFNNPASDVQQPVGDAIVVAGRVAPLGARVSIRLADWFPSWPYKFTNMADWFDKLGQTVTRKAASNVDDYYGYEIWNEPNGTWTSSLSFNDFWQQSFAKLRELDPKGKIIGPSLSFYDANGLRSFLTFAKANDCVPDIVSWHELGGGNLTANFQNYRQLEQDLGIGPLPISINEYSGKNDLTDEGMPGASAPMIAKFERFGIDSACISYWDVAHPGRLGSLLATDTSPNAGWWFYKWYGDMQGNMVSTTPPSPNDAAALDGFASVDPTAGKASVAFGGVNDGTVALSISGFHASAVFGTRVHAVVEHAHWVNRTTALTAAETLSSADLTIDGDQLSISVAQTNATDGYRVTLTPVDTPAGGGAGAGGAAAGGRSASAGAGAAPAAGGTGGARNGGGAGGLVVAVGGGGAGGAKGGGSAGTAMIAGGGSGGVAGGGTDQTGGTLGSAGSPTTGASGMSSFADAGHGNEGAVGGSADGQSAPAASSGCSCSFERRPLSRASGLALVLAALAAVRRRRTRLRARASTRRGP